MKLEVLVTFPYKGKLYMRGQKVFQHKFADHELQSLVKLGYMEAPPEPKKKKSKKTKTENKEEQ